MKVTTVMKGTMLMVFVTLVASGKKKVSFESWEFRDGCKAIVAAPAEMAENTAFPVYGGYKSAGGGNVHLGPVPATYKYRVTDDNGKWGDVTSASAPETTYKLTAWSDGNYSEVWDRRTSGKLMILTGGANPPARKAIWYKFDYDTARIMSNYQHENDQKGGPSQSDSAMPRVWKSETYLYVPPKNTPIGTLRCMPCTSKSHIYKIVMCVVTNGDLAWRGLYTLPKD